jgi:predicted nucleotidyltransferase
VSRRLDLVDALIYADGFDCALTLDEVRRYGPVDIEAEELRRELSLHPAVEGREGLYTLAGRGHLIDQRPDRIARARALQRRSRRVARVLRHLPFVRALVLTGSLAADDAREAADVDLMIVVSSGRLATAFLLMGPASTILRRRLFCPNYYLSEDQMALAPANRYVARELVQARCLAGSAAGLRRSNPWLADAFPNAGSPAPGLAGGGTIQRAMELPLRGRFGDALERIAARVARSRLRAHYRGRVPAEVFEAFGSGVSLRFHAGHTAERLLARYEVRCAEVALMLERAEAQKA